MIHIIFNKYLFTVYYNFQKQIFYIYLFNKENTQTIEILNT